MSASRPLRVSRRGLDRLGGPFAFGHEAISSCAVKWPALCANCLAFAGVLLALSYEARFGRAVKGLALCTKRLAFAGLRHGGGAKSASADHSN
jgi:hypothetical protein